MKSTQSKVHSPQSDSHNLSTFDFRLSTRARARGFSLIEFLVIIAIVAVIASIVGMSFRSARRLKVLDSNTAAIVGLLSQARVRTLSGKLSSVYGVHLESGQAVLYQGDAYNASAATNESYAVDPAVEIAFIALTGGGSDVLFERLTGKTANSGTFVVRLISEASLARTVTIESSGIVSSN